MDSFIGSAAAYANTRNFDNGAGRHEHVSGLSSFIRHRLILESEVVDAVLAQHSRTSVSKFVQEVYWRTYWKGWLQMRPAVWRDYLSGLARFEDEFTENSGRSTALSQAREGRTGIDCFDEWMNELVETGYLHNHARMWFASIWIFTLKLPWQLGAAFFMEHLLDGDAASNTLSWRWVAGLHTKGKHYLARADNIAKYTNGRFDPRGQLDENATPLEDPCSYAREALETRTLPPADGQPLALLITDDDCAPEFSALKSLNIAAIAALAPDESRVSKKVHSFKREALKDALVRAEPEFAQGGELIGSAEVLDWFGRSGAERVVALQSPVGPTADLLAEIRSKIPLDELTRDYDAELWPHATAGYFKFKQKLGL